MGYANGFNDGEDDMASNVIAGGIVSVRFLEANVEIGKVTCSRAKGGCKTRKKRRFGGRVVERHVMRLVSVGTHLFDISQLTTA